MNIVATYKKIENGLYKVLGFGKSDTRTVQQVSPAGFESTPLQGKKVVLSQTSNIDVNTCLGEIKLKTETKDGETRIYSEDENGILFEIFLKEDGKCYLGGNVDNAVRYLPLNTGLQDFIINLNLELVAIASGIASAGGSYTPTPQSIDVSGSKIDEVRTS